MTCKFRRTKCKSVESVCISFCWLAQLSMQYLQLTRMVARLWCEKILWTGTHNTHRWCFSVPPKKPMSMIPIFKLQTKLARLRSAWILMCYHLKKNIQTFLITCVNLLWMRSVSLNLIAHMNNASACFMFSTRSEQLVFSTHSMNCQTHWAVWATCWAVAQRAVETDEQTSETSENWAKKKKKWKKIVYTQIDIVVGWQQYTKHRI